MINVTFVLRNAQTKHGQNVFVIGSIPELGQWNVSRFTITNLTTILTGFLLYFKIDKAMKLQTEPEFYPMWTSPEIKLDFTSWQKPYSLEYKFVKIQEEKVRDLALFKSEFDP